MRQTLTDYQNSSNNTVFSLLILKLSELLTINFESIGHTNTNTSTSTNTSIVTNTITIYKNVTLCASPLNVAVSQFRDLTEHR